MAYQWRIRSLVARSWAKEVDILDLKISSWIAEQEEAWISNLPDIRKPHIEAFTVLTAESVAYLKRKKQWDLQHEALLQIAKNHNCDLVPIVTPQS